MNLNKVLLPVLLFVPFIFAQSLYVETLDEQKSSNNLLVLRFRVINNTPVTIRDASLRYCLTKSPDKVMEMEDYYVGNSQVLLENIDSTNACFSVKMDSIPYGVFPNESGFSVGVHYSDWKPRNKTLDFSNPQSSTFTRADNVALYIDETLLYGSDIQTANVEDAYLPEPSPLSAFDGVSVVLSPNEPYRFVWNHVDDAERYLLTVLREDSSLVHSAEYPTNVADVQLPVGRFLWNVQAVNSEKPARSLFSRFYRMNLVDFRSGDEGYRIGGTDTITSTDGRKDTRLLNVNWGELADLRKWDTVHAPLDPVTRPYDEEEGSRCWAIAVYNLNHHYRMSNGQKGNLTLDEIVALGHMYEELKSFYDTATTPFPLKYEDWREKVKRNGSKSPAVAAFPLNQGGFGDFMLSWALNIPPPKEYSTGDDFQGNQELITKMWIDSLSDGKPIYVNQCNFQSSECDENNRQIGRHAMIVDGYRYGSDGSVEFHFLNTDNYGTHEWRLFEVGDWRVWQYIYSFFIISDVDTVRATLPEVHVDSDSDGVMDFDELYRFESDYRLRDTDNDGIDDKTEIHSYVIREKVVRNNVGSGTSIYANNPLVRVKGSGVVQETLVDIDKDGRRAENDDDSDGDGMKDGEEDLNHNGIVDIGETDPYYNDNRGITESEIPEDVLIYASDFVRINDGVKFFKAPSNSDCKIRCVVAAEGKDGISVIVGARAKVGEIFSKGQVWVRNQGTVEVVRYYGMPQEFTTVLQSVSSLNEFYTGIQDMDFNLYEYQWPYHIPEFTVKIVNTNAEKIVRAGECDTLKGAVSFKTIKVEAGGRLYFDEGEITVNNLQLDAGATIDFVKPGFSTILHVNEKIQWNASTENEDKSSVAKGFKLYYYGSDRFFVHGAWAGTIIAPNAQLVLGQTHNKELYGQFYGKSVTVHQYSEVYRVPFKPQKSITPSILLDVAWIGGQK